ncbi:MAG TPA: hypothetical protein VF189_06280 [Patescibacteria group bacterium]
MEKFLYFAYNIFIFTPVFAILFKFYKKHITKHLSFILVAIIIGFLYGQVTDSMGIMWQAWIYDPHKTLGFFGLGEDIDTIIFGIGVSSFFAIMVTVFAQKEEKKKSFWKI